MLWLTSTAAKQHVNLLHQHDRYEPIAHLPATGDSLRPAFKTGKRTLRIAAVDR